MFLSKAISSALLIASAAIATPVAVPETPVDLRARHLAKRGEGLHLVNCGDRYSAVIYCPNDSDCNRNPGPGNQCIPQNGNVFTWEGGRKQCKFDTGTTFVWNIASNAQQQSNFVNVGSADNGFHGFNIFKDDKHVMYTDGNGNQCRSIYYSLPA